MAEQTPATASPNSEPSLSLVTGICAWAGLVLFAAPLMLVSRTRGNLGLYGFLATFTSVWLAYGGVVSGFFQMRNRRPGGLVVSLTAMALGLLLIAAAAMANSSRDFFYGLFLTLPVSLGPFAAPLAARAMHRHHPVQALVLVGFWLAPSLGLLAIGLWPGDWQGPDFRLLAYVQSGPWLRLVAYASGTATAWRPMYWGDVLIALAMTAALVGMALLFITRPRIRPALVIPYASLAALWIALGLLQLVYLIHEGGAVEVA